MEKDQKENKHTFLYVEQHAFFITIYSIYRKRIQVRAPFCKRSYKIAKRKKMWK